MNSIRSFVKSILWVEVIALAGLLICGAVLTWAERGHRYGDSFFSYRIHAMDALPAWFAACLLVFAVNGFWMFRLANIEGAVNTQRSTGSGEWGASVPINPLRLFAINLVAIPAALALFLLIRANGW